nr:MAG TPA: RNA polymerase-like protein [Siphoviridae sp. ctl617]
MHHTDTVRIATNPRKWRRPAPCPACRKSRPLILTLGAIYNLRTRKPVNTIYGCICPNCRHKCILHVDGKNLKKAIRLWNHHASHTKRNNQ